MKKILTLLATAVLAISAQAGEYPDISITELKKAIADKQVTVIDANGNKSFTEKGHIPTAINFHAKDGEIAKALPSDKGALIVAYCGGPLCNAYEDAAKKATELGYTNVKHLSAGISGWLQAGEPTEK